MKLIIVPDIHIGKQTSIGKDAIGVGLNSRVQDQADLLDFVYSKILEIKPLSVILLGDIWEDVNPRSSYVRVVFAWIKKIVDLNISVHIIMGNHDFVRSGHERVSMLDSFDALQMERVHIHRNIEPIYFNEQCAAVAVPFCDRKQLMLPTIHEAQGHVIKNVIATRLEIFKRLESVKNTENLKVIMLGHLALEGSFYVGDEVDDESNEIFVPLEAFAGYDCAIMGHVHNQQELYRDGRTVFGHLGSLDKTSFSEKDKFIAVYDPDVGLDYIKLPCRELIDIDIDVPSEEKDATSYVSQQIEKNKDAFENSIVRIKVKLNSHDAENVDKDKIIANLNKNGVFHVPSFCETRSLDRVLVKNAEVDESVNPIQGFKIFLKTIDAEPEFKDECFELGNTVIKTCFANLANKGNTK